MPLRSPAVSPRPRESPLRVMRCTRWLRSPSGQAVHRAGGLREHRATRAGADDEEKTMNITVVNRSHRIADAELQTVIRAINRQIAEDFAPHWGLAAPLRLEGRCGRSLDR